jgi:signal transduction histidine kinase
MRRARRLPPEWTTPLFVIGIVASVGAMGWLGYRAIHGWRDSATLLAEQRASETVDRLVTALGRDMRGVQSTVLSSAQWDRLMLDSPYDVRNLAASAFARYPYPESFFAWRGVPKPGAVVFLNRADRRPAWMSGEIGPSRFPVLVEVEPAVAAMLVDRVVQDAARRRRFSIFEATIGGTRYQIVTRLLYQDPVRGPLEGVFGFTVNLAWARQRYFGDVTRQVARIGNSTSTLPLTVLDARGATVASSSAGPLREPVRRRELPLMFFDPQLVALDPPADLPREVWTVAAAAGGDPTLANAVRASNGTLAVAALAVAVLAIGLVMTARATQARARLAGLRSDFVSTVTHELKTPIATIRAAGDTMARGRLSGPDALKDCAQLVVQESKRLTRLVDNLLAYSRVTDVTEVYTWDAIDPAALLHDVIGGFRRALDAGGFEVEVGIPSDIPPIRGDWTACVLLFDNLVDNAIRYSTATRRLAVRARADGAAVTIEIADSGPGIPPDELPKVTRRFFRGRAAGSGGSGLGLAIANRIVEDHAGALRIRSTVGAGTTVSVTLPAAEHVDEETRPGR